MPIRYTLLLLALLIGGEIAQSQERPSASLTLLPTQVTLQGAAGRQRLLTEAAQKGRFVGDWSAQATYTSANPQVARVAKDGTVYAVRDGMTTITARVQGQQATTTVRVVGTQRPFTWSFRDHVLPVLTKASCNSGACHGASAGKGGLKLTLRGYDPAADHAVLTRQANGRRVVAGDPAQSLLLLKPTMGVPHGGGTRIKPGSSDYALLASWIRSGAPMSKPNAPTLEGLEVFPATASLSPGAAQQVIVLARYADGRREDVTQWVKFGVSDSAVATVDDSGKVTVRGQGEAAVTLWFSSKVAFARIISPFGSPRVSAEPSPKPAAPLDTLIQRKLDALGLPVSPPCTDEQFLRRAFLSACGVLPTVQEAQAFLQDRAPDKRQKLIESLLRRPEFTDYWAYQWSDLLLVSTKKLAGNAANAFYQWVRQSVETNKPWDKFAREILTAQGSNLENGAANYFVLHKDAIELTETTTQAFLGTSLTCARCHNHPLEKWTQRDYYQMANLFGRVRLKNGDQGGETLVLTATEGEVNHPRLGVPLPPRPLDGVALAFTESRDRRQMLADWLTSPQNSAFAKALVNRVWRRLMGRGIVEAEDDLRLTNPPSNPELLEALATDFARGGYDVRKLIRQIMTSDAFQRSAEPVGLNAKDDRYYSRYLVHRLPAETILDALSQVTQIPTAFEGYPKGTRALQLPDSQIASYFLTAFGRPAREQTCACERQEETNVAQALHLANGETLNQKLRASGGLLDQLATVSDTQALETLYLTALCRYPTPAEREKALAILAENPDHKPETRRAALEDLCWAIVTDREFLFNH